MTAFLSNGSHQTVTGSAGFSTKIASVGGPATVTRISVTGIIAVEGLSASLSTTAYADYNLSAGIQYGNTGYGVVANTTGSTAGASYLTWNELTEGFQGNIWTAGAPPQAISQVPSVALGQVWTGLFPVPVGNDFYLVVGSDTGAAYVPTFKGRFTWNVQFATYP